MYIYMCMTRKAKTDLMALAIFDQQSVFNSLLCSHLYLDDDETWFPESCIIVHHNNKYSWTLRHSISAIDHASFDGAV